MTGVGVERSGIGTDVYNGTSVANTGGPLAAVEDRLTVLAACATAGPGDRGRRRADKLPPVNERHPTLRWPKREQVGTLKPLWR
jgi:hypothetical protein